jgi:hypothetical protein
MTFLIACTVPRPRKRENHRDPEGYLKCPYRNQEFPRTVDDIEFESIAGSQSIQITNLSLMPSIRRDMLVLIENGRLIGTKSDRSQSISLMKGAPRSFPCQTWTESGLNRRTRSFRSNRWVPTDTRIAPD